MDILKSIGWFIKGCLSLFAILTGLKIIDFVALSWWIIIAPLIIVGLIGIGLLMILGWALTWVGKGYRR